MIGIFDSGVGGLTVLRAIQEVLPSADVIYFGDIKNAPYGEKSREEIAELTIANIKFLLGRGATDIVSACNSVSASLAVSLFDAFSLNPNQLIEMVGPTVSWLRDTDKRITLVATPATIQSQIYQNAFRMIGKDITAVPLSGLAGAIEFGHSAEEIERIIEAGLKTADMDAMEVLVLACTHYPLVTDSFKKIVGNKVIIVDPAEAVADRVERTLWPRQVGDGKKTFVISAESAQFRTLAKKLFPEISYQIEVLG